MFKLLLVAFSSFLLCAPGAQLLAAQTPAFSRPAGAAEITEVAAGYQALFTCSAHFFAGRPLQDIIDVELVDLQALELPEPEIDVVRQLVHARDNVGNSATAAFRDNVGCTLLPPHWQQGDIGNLPYIAYPATPDMSAVAFPAGDRAQPKPNRKQRALINSAFDGKSFGENTVTVGVAVVHKGKLVAEQYRDGFGIHSGYRTWSTAKSISATLIGIAQRDGLLSVDQPATIPEWQFFDDPRQAITFANLLHMSSGLYSEGANTAAIYFGGQDVVSAATNTRLEVAPNTRWKYANNDTLLLMRALRATLADDLRYMRYPYDELFHRIGMYHTRMEMDHLGNFIGSSQVYTTARDLARFGLLYLHEGVFEGERILPAAWTKYVAEAAPTLPREQGKRGYGAQFWLFDRLEGVPAGTYTTAGNKGQFATIIPQHDMVIVRIGVDPDGKFWRQDQFVNAIVAAFD